MAKKEASASRETTETVPSFPEIDTANVDTADLNGDRHETIPDELLDGYADHLTQLVAGETPDAAAGELGRRTASAGVGARTFLEPYSEAFDVLISSVFDDLEDGADTDAAQEKLRKGVATTLADMGGCVEGFVDGRTDGLADTSVSGDANVPANTDVPADATLNVGRVLEALPMPAFIIAPDHTVLACNYGLCEMLSIDEREALGEDNRETIAAASYTDGRRHESLVDKVADAPRRAHEENDVDRVDMPFSDHLVYEDASTLLNRRDEEIHIGFWAIPLFDENDELTAVLEVCDDRTEEVNRQESVSALVEEVTDTLGKIGDGNLSTRAEYRDEHGVIDDTLLTLTDDVNAMAENFQKLVEQVDDRTSTLAETIDEAVSSANRIDERVSEQRESLEEVAEEMESFSATMEEVAASSNEVATAAKQALSEAEDGLDSGEVARDVAADVLETSDDLLDSVEQLESQMDEIGEVVEVISDVADQTNILALNANIEAARAGEDGDGFAVVADEVKGLATQTQDHADDITDLIETLRRRARDTVESVEDSHASAEKVDEEIEETLDSLQEIVTVVETAADGIDEVADANDEQAATVEEVTATVEDASQRAKEVEETAAEIVRGMDSQADSVDDLSNRVSELTGEADE